MVLARPWPPSLRSKATGYQAHEPPRGQASEPADVNSVSKQAVVSTSKAGLSPAAARYSKATTGSRRDLRV